MNTKPARLGIIFALLGILLLSTAQIANADKWNPKGKRIKGSRNMTSESRDHNGFTGVHIQGSSDVEITIGEKFSVEVEAEDNLIELIETEVRDGILQIDYADGYSINFRRDSRVIITMPALEKLSISGSADIRASNVSGDELTVSIAGSGDVKLSGKVEYFQVSISGSGDVNAKRLIAKEAIISIQGSGDVDISVDDYIEAKVSGSGDITYYGDPKVKKRVRGSGDINQRRR